MALAEGDGKNARITALKLANQHIEDGRLDDAWPLIDRALRDDPNDAQAMMLAGLLHEKTGRHSIAYQLAVRATQLAPGRPEPWNNLGVCADELWRAEEAERAYRKAIQLASDNQSKGMYLVNLGAILVNTGEFERAEPVLREALERFPESKKGRANLGFAELALQKWATAWDNYHYGLGLTANRRLVQYGEEPQWDGSPGKTVAIYGEQGLGDEISFASMIPDAIRDCKRVIIDCDPRLVGLYSRSFPTAKVYGTRFAKNLDWSAEDTKIDASAAVGALGQLYRRSKESFPGTPYLVPDPDRVAMWKALFASKGKPAIGVAWTGGIEKTGAKFRRVNLRALKPVFDALDAHYVCLQYKDAAKEIADSAMPVTQYPYGTLTKDYDDTAAMVAACDLVITMQSTVAHLAGALGVPCWVMVSATSQWRYGVYGDTMPWYKSVTMYRCRERGEWQGVIQKIAADLRKWK